MGRVESPMRLKNWKDNFVNYIHANTATVFSFGEHDCCLTACNLLREITGIDPGDSFRGEYEGPVEMFAILKKNGGVEKIADKICAEHNWKEIPPLFASKGDLVMIDAGRHALGVIDLNGKEIMCAGPIGFTRMPLSEGLKAWRIT